MVPGSFLEQDSVCHAAGTAIIRHVTTAGAAKGAGSLALATGRLAVVIGLSHLEAGQLVRPYRQGGSLLETQNIPQK